MAAILAIASWYIGGSVGIFSPKKVLAEGVLPGETVSTNPKTRSTSVTASVKNLIPPTIPLLISPENNKILYSNTVTFIWKESSDVLGVSKYQLFIDGSMWMDDIGPGAETTSDFTLTYSSGNWTLIPKKTLSDGAHTWKIKAFDSAGNTSESATWNFTIDSIAPAITISSIDGVSVNISSKDSGTIPAKPISIPQNEPSVKGNTEANTTVKLVLTVPGRPVYNAQTTSDSSGNYSFTLPILPSDTSVELQVEATDSAGNNGKIEKLFIIIQIPAATPVTIPIGPIVIKVPVIPISPVPEAAPIETPAPAPIEVIREPFREKIEYVLSRTLFPAPGQVQFVEKTYVRPLANYWFGLMLPSLHLGLAIWLTELSLLKLTPLRLWGLLRASGLTFLPPPPEEKSGLVFDAKTGEPVAYAVVGVYLRNEENQPAKRIAERITNAYGRYEEILVPHGKTYLLTVQHREHEYRSDLGEIYQERRGYYRGGIINESTYPEISKSNQKIYSIKLMIPTLKKEQKKESSGSVILSSYVTTPTWLWVLSSLFLSALALWAFTPWNILMAILYWVGTARHLVDKEPISVRKV